MEDNEPWKVLIRNNIKWSIPKKAKKWKDLPILDSLMGQFEVAPAGSDIFKSLGKAWEHVRHSVNVKLMALNRGILLITDQYGGTYSIMGNCCPCFKVTLH